MKPKRTADLSLFLTVTGLLLASLLSEPAFGQSVIQNLVQNIDTLRFENFHVPIYTGKPAPINWKSVPLVSRHDKKITYAIKHGVNFAGHYRIVEWNCGPEHKCWVIVDVKTGWIYEQYPTTCGMDFKSDSRMLVGSDCMPGQIHAGGNDGVFEWRNNRLIQLQLGGR